mmetsp:Transcript_12679/g.16654  ORF Transcript_12679/g.16654 Transcript_12679/m.16654 type:complete len:93 (-) Transcript_12679:496-774(-)
MSAPLTTIIQKAARLGKRFSLSGGKEYEVPRSAEPMRVARRAGVQNTGFAQPKAIELIKLRDTIKIAIDFESCPEAIGKYGLLIRSIFTSVI